MCVRRSRRSVVDPSSHFRNPPSPCVPITMRSAASAVAALENGDRRLPNRRLDDRLRRRVPTSDHVAATNSRSAGSVSRLRQILT